VSRVAAHSPAHRPNANYGKRLIQESLLPEIQIAITDLRLVLPESGVIATLRSIVVSEVAGPEYDKIAAVDHFPNLDLRNIVWKTLPRSRKLLFNCRETDYAGIGFAAVEEIHEEGTRLQNASPPHD
jgi:hypothetical protein